jgi:hypothetical protein
MMFTVRSLSETTSTAAAFDGGIIYMVVTQSGQGALGKRRAAEKLFNMRDDTFTHTTHWNTMHERVLLAGSKQISEGEMRGFV